MPDYIINGAGHGSVAQTLLQNDMNALALRPWVGQGGGHFIDVFNGVQEGKPTFKPQPIWNSQATLRKDEWKLLDDAVIRVGKPRLRGVADLRSAGLTYTVANGLGKTVLQYEDQSDISPATVSMDGISYSDGDRPVYSLKNLPLPIIHKDFKFNIRQILASRNGTTPLDTTGAELASRRCSEEAEKLLMGTSEYNGYSYGEGLIYGYTTFPKRLTKSLTDPEDGDWTPAKLVDEILEMKTQSQDSNHYGPWFCYISTDWDAVMDADYSAAKGDNTLRDRIGRIDDIDRPKTLDYLPPRTILLVEKDSAVTRIVIGMEFMTIQWETHGGMEVNFKVMGIMVPQLRADQADQTGIVHGSYTPD